MDEEQTTSAVTPASEVASESATAETVAESPATTADSASTAPAVEEKKMVTVYEFDADDRLHPYTGTAEIEEGTALADNQTDVEPDGRFFNGQKWTNEIVTVYGYDKDDYYDGSMKIVPDGEALESNETLLAPSDQLHKAKFVEGAWVEGLTADEIKNLTPADDETTNKQMINVLGQKLAAATLENTQLKQTVNALGQSNAQVKQMVNSLGQTIAQLKMTKEGN